MLRVTPQRKAPVFCPKVYWTSRPKNDAGTYNLAVCKTTLAFAAMYIRSNNFTSEVSCLFLLTHIWLSPNFHPISRIRIRRSDKHRHPPMHSHAVDHRLWVYDLSSLQQRLPHPHASASAHQHPRGGCYQPLDQLADLHVGAPTDLL